MFILLRILQSSAVQELILKTEEEYSSNVQVTFVRQELLQSGFLVVWTQQVHHEGWPVIVS